MIEKIKPTYEELLEWNDAHEKDYKAFEILKSAIICASMMFIFGIISDLAKIGTSVVFETMKLSPNLIQICTAFLQIGITFVYTYMAWHFIIIILFTYKEDINAFGGKWDAFKAWCKKEEETK